jgi:dTDP-4-amino-4,6-dideoxygalactose transaminase
MIPISAPVLGGEEEAVARVLRSGMLAQGPLVKEFEEKFAAYIGTKYAVATSNGTTALHTALLAAGIKPDDEVITSPFSFIATANSILHCGAKPVFVDIGNDFNADASLIEEKITAKTKALLPVHLYGLPCDMDALRSICKKHDLILVEDACQAHGSEYAGRKAGSFGIGCFSFYPTKNMTTGEGGMITTDDAGIAEAARCLRNHGSAKRYVHTCIGFNYRMTDISAAIGLVQLKKLDASIAKRMENAQALTALLDGVKGIIPPSVTSGKKHSFNQYTIRVTKEFPETRDGLKKILADAGIASEVYYPTPIHMQPCYKQLGDWGNMPKSEAFAGEVLSLPIHPAVSKGDLKRIAELIIEA